MWTSYAQNVAATMKQKVNIETLTFEQAYKIITTIMGDKISFHICKIDHCSQATPRFLFQQLWRINFSPQLQDKIWDRPGNKATGS